MTAIDRLPTPFADRLASVRAGTIAAAAALATTTILGAIAIARPFGAIDSIGAIALPAGFGPDQVRPWLRLGFSAATGFLFGVTYRYAVRSDPANPHLKSGAIGAFALTRTFAAVERIPLDPLAIAIAAAAASLPLAIAAIALERTVLRTAGAAGGDP